MKLEKINDSYIYYNEEHLYFIRSYYLYCCEIIKEELLEKPYSLNIILGDYFIRFQNKNKVFKIDIQFEHTLVKEGGRDSENSIKGKIKIEGEDDYYLVRICNLKQLKKLDYIIEYSKPNLINISHINNLQEYYKKTCLIFPLIYSFDTSVLYKGRDKNIITTFTNPSESRRFKILELLKNNNLKTENIINKFSDEEIKDLYSSSKILINVHQTDYHHTLEELRILPALLNGCIVISENVPLKEDIIYSRYIIWCDYENIVETTKKVSDNYEYYFNKLFFDPDFLNILNSMKQINKGNIRKMLEDITNKKTGRNQVMEGIYYYFKSRTEKIMNRLKNTPCFY